MRWFLDMCILIYHASRDNSQLSKKTAAFFSKNKGKKFLLCHYLIEKDLPKWIKRQKILTDEVIKKIKDPSYELNFSKNEEYLYKTDKQKAEKLIVKAEFTKDKDSFVKTLINLQKDMESVIFNFIRNEAEKVILIAEIDEDLKSQLFTFLNNISDSNILASAIQYHNKEELTLLTGDKKDWNKNNIEWVFDSRPDLAKKYNKIPEIKYIQNM